MTTVADVAAFERLVAEVQADPGRVGELVALLHEAAPVYDGRGAATAGRMRGLVLAAFASTGLPPEAVPALVEALRTGVEAFSVAAAARGARGSVAPPPELCEAMVTALVRMRARDSAVSFDGLRPTWPADDSTTALTEVLRTLTSWGPAAHRVHADLIAVRTGHAALWSPQVRRALDAAVDATARAPLGMLAPEPMPDLSPPQPVDGADVRDVVLEDQAGERVTFAEMFTGRHHVVAFFYTRCGNPHKCSATITRLARLAGRLETAALRDRVGVVAVTYDPGYDLPERMAAYGRARGMRFSDDVRMLRSQTGLPTLRAHFDLLVGYAGSIVNQHGVELYLVGPDAATEHVWRRVEWDVDEVLATVRERVLSPPRAP